MFLLTSALEEGQERQNFQHVYEQNYRTMYHVALGILKNKEEAEDAVHSAFVKLAEKFGKYRHLSEQEMTSLCVVIVKNKSLDMLRVSKSGMQSELEKVDFALFSNTEQPLDAMIEQENANEIANAMRCLPEKLRLVLELKYFHEYNNSEIADILDLSRKNVEIRLYRAKKKMKEVLQNGKTGQRV